MSCPTCSHTMQALEQMHANELQRQWWCPRCGTLSVTSPDGSTVTMSRPKLVDRCREFAPGKAAPLWTRWHRLSINESIWPEHERRDER